MPAATLLLPYFEVPLDAPITAWGYPNTTFTIGNSSASAAVAHVTLWTDLGVPTYAFDVYLTGFDVEVINLRLLFLGIPPVTADVGADPTNRISNQGIISQDINALGSVTGPCAFPADLYQRLSVADVAALQAAHTGDPSALLGGSCGGASHGDNVARGFVTVDSVSACTAALPTDPTYFAAIADQRNILFGEYWVIDADNNYAHGDSLVAIESSPSDPLTDGAGDYTFYGRLANVNGAGTDHREGLPTAWMGRYVNGGTLDAGTTAFVWRDAWPRAPFTCASPPAGLTQANLTGFDEQEQADFFPVNVDYLPLATEAVRLTDPSRIPLEYSFGFLYYDLKLGAAVPPFGTTRQSHVTHAYSAWGRFEGAFTVWPLDNVSAPRPSDFTVPPCSNGIDDDGDTFIDYPADPGCQAPGGIENPPCDDDLDNDGDTLIDYPADPGCQFAWHWNEGPECHDGIDNDGDTFTDWPADPGCRYGYSTDESPQCDDGFDNDGDTFIDFPADPQCTAAWDFSESS